MSKLAISSNAAPKAVGPYSQAVIAGGFLFISGQIPIDPASQKLLDASLEEQTRLVMKNIGAILKAANASYENIVRCTLYLTDLSQFAAVNKVYAEFFDENPPARVTVQVAALPLGAKIEIDAIAYTG